MKRILLISFLLMLMLILSMMVLPVIGQEAVPTLVPPTLVPTTAQPSEDALRGQSAVARIQSESVVRVGILLNEPPYGVLDIRGEVTGYDADVARALAEAWRVEVEFVHVTRQSAIEALLQDRVDMLIAAQVHRRELDEVVEFSHSYRISSQSLMLRADDGAVSLLNMVGRKVGYVIGTEAEQATQAWLASSGQGVTSQAYYTIDQAYRALLASEIDGVVGRWERLRRVSSNQPEAVKILDEPVSVEPFAIAVPRQDVAMRNLVNRTLQYLVENNRLVELHESYFPGQDFPYDAIPLWDNIGDESPQPGQYSTDIPYPQQYRAAQVLMSGERVMRVAGLAELPEDAPESDKRVLAFQQGLITQIAERWGARVELVPGDPIEALESGAADLAVGVPLDWSLADRVDFSQPVLLHGDRMLRPSDRDINSFLDLRGRWVGVIATDGNAEERAQEWADSVNVQVRFFTVNFADNIITVLTDSQNADVIFGDSLLLVPQIQNNPGVLELTDRWYSREYMGLAVPRNDIDFRLLVDYTLQEMQRDGTLSTLLQPIFPADEDMPQFDYWPGRTEYLGLSLAP